MWYIGNISLPLVVAVTLCISPSLLVYSLYTYHLPFILGLVISFIPLICGTVRLAKYNLETDENSHISYFIGLSTPISTVTILAYMYFNNQIGGEGFYGDPNIALGLVVILGILMSNIDEVCFSSEISDVNLVISQRVR